MALQEVKHRLGLGLAWDTVTPRQVELSTHVRKACHDGMRIGTLRHRLRPWQIPQAPGTRRLAPASKQSRPKFARVARVCGVPRGSRHARHRTRHVGIVKS